MVRCLMFKLLKNLPINCKQQPIRSTFIICPTVGLLWFICPRAVLLVWTRLAPLLCSTSLASSVKLQELTRSPHCQYPESPYEDKKKVNLFINLVTYYQMFGKTKKQFQRVADRMICNMPL